MIKPDEILSLLQNEKLKPLGFECLQTYVIAARLKRPTSEIRLVLNKLEQSGAVRRNIRYSVENSIAWEATDTKKEPSLEKDKGIQNGN